MFFETAGQIIFLWNILLLSMFKKVFSVVTANNYRLFLLPFIQEFLGVNLLNKLKFRLFIFIT